MPMRIVVSGMIASVPRQGGATWAVLQYVIGLQELGHDVYFIEQIPESALSPAGTSLSASGNAAYFRSVVSAFGIEDRSMLTCGPQQPSVGLDHDAFRSIARDADLLVNLSGLLTAADLLEEIPVRLYVDLDPCFTQLWQAVEGIDMRLASHTHFATVGWHVGSPSCSVPDCGVSWIPTWQPLVLRYWPPSTARLPGPDAGWTTIANWRGYGSIRHRDIHYGQKAHSLRWFIELPRRARRTFRLALQIHPDEHRDLRMLEDQGWEILDPVRAAGSPQTYQRFIQASRGEFGVAKSGYVHSRCGWFSDRSICYLATGRPVVAQATGIGSLLPAGEGLFFFQTVDEVLAALDAVDSDYDRHARAAREIAEQYFDSRSVLGRLLEAVGGSR